MHKIWRKIKSKIFLHIYKHKYISLKWYFNISIK